MVATNGLFRSATKVVQSARSFFDSAVKPAETPHRGIATVESIHEVSEEDVNPSLHAKTPRSGVRAYMSGIDPRRPILSVHFRYPHELIRA